MPPRVPRWLELEQAEYDLLSNQGYPMPVRGKGYAEFKANPTTKMCDTKAKNNADIFIERDPFKNPLAQSSKGVMMREFNRPFPKLQHRFSNGVTLQNGKVLGSQTLNTSTRKFQVRTIVPGVLWPALTMKRKNASIEEGHITPDIDIHEHPQDRRVAMSPVDYSRQFQDFRPSSALALSNSSHGLLSATLFPRSATPFFIATKPAVRHLQQRSQSVPLIADPNSSGPNVDTSRKGRESPVEYGKVDSPQRTRNPENEASATVQAQPPYVRSRAWVSAVKFTGKRWEELR